MLSLQINSIRTLYNILIEISSELMIFRYKWFILFRAESESISVLEKTYTILFKEKRIDF